jgi:hypothetical protein
MDEVRGDQFRCERGYHVREKDDSLGDTGPDQIEGGRQDDNIQDIID